MEWLEQITRPEIWNLKAYSSARSEMSDFTGMIQLDANENPYIPYPQTPIVHLTNRYPDPRPIKLRSRMAATYKVQLEQVLLTRGMDEVIDLLVRTFCIPYKDSIAITPPTFGYYKVAADISAVNVVNILLDVNDNFNLDIDKLIKECVNKVKIVFLCSPNNPTGTVLDLSTIEVVAKGLPNSIIAIDEAYIEFSDIDSATVLLNKYQNLVVMRTLSKAYAFAGARIGALLASTQIIELVSKVLAPYPLPDPIINLALELFSPHGIELTQSRIEIIKSERERMYHTLSQIKDIQVFNSHANFLLLSVSNASETYQNLLSRGIIIRNRSKDIPNTIRITIGTPTENNLVLSAFGLKNSNSKPHRQATLVRKTNETDILVEVNLDAKAKIKVTTGIGFFDHMLEQLAKHGGFGLNLSAKGDTHIDYHHTVEDVAITLGSALKKALGDKRGINRYGFVLPMDESCAFATIDLSGRGVCVLDAKFPSNMIGSFPVEMVEHFFLSLAMNLDAAIHLKVTGDNTHHMVEGLFKACPRKAYC